MLLVIAIRHAIASLDSPSTNASRMELGHNYIFPQAPFVTDFNVGFATYGWVYMMSHSDES